MHKMEQQQIIRMQKLFMTPSVDSTWPCAWLASATGQVPNIISNYYYLSNNNRDNNDIDLYLDGPEGV